MIIIEVEPLPKPKKKSKKSRLPNPQKEGRIKDNEAIKTARKEYCQWCGLSKTGIWYQVHHIRHRSQKDGHDIPENLICLCNGPGSNHCHDRAHSKIVDGKPPIIANDLREMLTADNKIRQGRCLVVGTADGNM